MFRASLEWCQRNVGAELFIETLLACGVGSTRSALSGVFGWLHRSHSIKEGLLKQRCPLPSPGLARGVAARLDTQPVFHHLFVKGDNALSWSDHVPVELRDTLCRLAAEGWKPYVHAYYTPSRRGP